MLSLISGVRNWHVNRIYKRMDGRYTFADLVRPERITEKRIVIWDDMTTFVERGFLAGTRIEEIVFEHTRLTTLPTDFLCGCRHLRSVDLSGLSSVRKIKSGFMRDCPSLVDIDLAPLGNVVAIGPYFLEGASSLRTLNLSPFRYIIQIPNCFGLQCFNLEHVDFTGLSNIRAIGEYFLPASLRLRSIDLTPLTGLIMIGQHFLIRSGIRSISFDSLYNLDMIAGGALVNCKNLARIEISNCSNLVVIGDNFAQNCKSLDSLTITRTESLERLGHCFLEGSGIKTLNISSLVRLTEILSNFCNKCPRLSLLRLPVDIEIIGARFCSGCVSLKLFEFKQLSGVVFVDNYFMTESGLESAYVVTMANLRKCGTYFLALNPSLAHACLPEWVEYGEECLSHCPLLSTSVEAAEAP
jgi:hypothetical protein